MDMVIDTATNIAIVIPTSITMVMAMDMVDMKNNEIYIDIKKPPHCGGFL